MEEFPASGMGRTYLWVDGVQAEPIEPNTEKLTHFIWVDPEDRCLRLDFARWCPPSYVNVGL